MKNVSDDIKMEFGLDKCAKASFKRGKKISAEGIPEKYLTEAGTADDMTNVHGKTAT